MQLTSQSFKEGDRIPDAFAFGIKDATQHVKLGHNRNPHLAWENVPEGTQSFALICHDPDVPSRGDDVNQPGKTVPASLPRVDFYHWVLFDLPASTREITEGSFSNAVTPRGKPGPNAPQDTRQGINNYTDWFAADKDMNGDYYGYDGPCPPWNDEIIHHYVFTVYALSIEKLPLEGKTTGPDVLAAITPHILGKASLTGVYALNPAI